MPTTKLSRKKHAKIHAALAAGKSTRQAMKLAGVSLGTVNNYAKVPLPEPAAASAKLPPSWAEDYPAFLVDGPAKVLVLSDVHIPFHVSKALEAAVEFGKKNGADTVLLNGDVCDFHCVSRYDHDGSKLTYVEEIESGKQFLRWLRAQFPKGRIIYKEGNHDERLNKYILSRAPTLFGLEYCTLPSLLGLSAVGADHVGEQRVVHVGKLRVIHGHEYGSGTSAPVNAARWLMLRARKPALMGHLHQTSEQIEMDIDGNQLAAWSVGCLCGLNPRYRRLSTRWNHGFAFVTVSKDGTFEVRNLRVSNGKVI